MRKYLTGAAFTAAFISMSGLANATPVNLSTWNDEPANAGNWVVGGGGSFVDQTINGAPTFFIGGINAVGQQLTGTFRVGSDGDDDFAGFVVGFNAGDSNSAAADYLLIDWKQGDQFPAVDGLAVSRVTGLRGSNNDFWQHVGSVQELARANNFGSTGYVDNQTYTFEIEFDLTSLKVFVDNVLEIDIQSANVGNGTDFNGGNFGFYNYSQSTVRYGAVTQTVIIPGPGNVPEPTTIALLGLGLAGLGFAVRRRKTH